jgi:hypothetical protein
MMVPDISRILSMKRMMLFIETIFIETDFFETAFIETIFFETLFAGKWAVNAVNAVNVLVITARVSSRRAP